MWDILFWFYLTNAVLLILHEIDSAYWKEWELFRLPGGVAGFLLVHVPILYLVLYGLVLIPEEVQAELTVPAAPDSVKTWLASRPEWIHIERVREDEFAGISVDLDRGERAAIALAKKQSVRILREKSGQVRCRATP